MSKLNNIHKPLDTTIHVKKITYRIYINQDI